MTPTKEQLQAEYQTVCAYLGDAHWKMKNLQAYIAQEEAKLAALEKKFTELPKEQTKESEIITHDDAAVNG